VIGIVAGDKFGTHPLKPRSVRMVVTQRIVSLDLSTVEQGETESGLFI